MPKPLHWLRLALFLVAWTPLVLACGGGGGAGAGDPNAGGPADPAAPTPVAPDANGIADFGVVTFDANRLTPELALQVPADAFAITLEAVANVSGEAEIFGLARFFGPDGRVYENRSSVDGLAEHHWAGAIGGAGFVLPITDRPGMGLVLGGGVYKFRFSVNSTATLTSLRVRAIVRSGNSAALGALNLTVWIALGQPFDAATAATNARMTQILAATNGFLAAHGLAVGTVEFRDLFLADSDAVSLPPSSNEFDALIEQTSALTLEGQLNVLLVRSLLDPSDPPGVTTLGKAAQLGGPLRVGTSASGVAVADDGSLASAVVGRVLAHEIGHLLGLRHTVESTGEHDLIDDTPECPANGTSAACPVEGGGMLMHWFREPGAALFTAAQGQVLRAHALVRYGPSVHKRWPTWTPSLEDVEALRLAPPVRCSERALPLEPSR